MNIMGYYLNDDKNINIELTNIYGIGKKKSNKLCKKIKILNLKVSSLKKKKILKISDFLSKNLIGFELKNKIKKDLKRLIDIKCYRGSRHVKKLPSRGQRTRTNAKTSRKILRIF
ncbi:30S ribosomal protein S13 [Candidatus Vidania fulgoroideorum]